MELVLSDPPQGCTQTHNFIYRQAVLLVERGGCPFVQKMEAAAAAGAKAVIIRNTMLAMYGNITDSTPSQLQANACDYNCNFGSTWVPVRTVLFSSFWCFLSVCVCASFLWLFHVQTCSKPARCCCDPVQPIRMNMGNASSGYYCAPDTCSSHLCVLTGEVDSSQNHQACCMLDDLMYMGGKVHSC